MELKKNQILIINHVNPNNNNSFKIDLKLLYLIMAAYQSQSG